LRRIKKATNRKVLALLLSVSLIAVIAFGGTLALIMSETPELVNTFLSGLDPVGDLVISKEVTHPFGSTFSVPSNLSFDFTVNLGKDYAGKTLQTSQGEIKADAGGKLSVSVAPDEAICIEEIKTGTSVTVTEKAKDGFTPKDGAEKSAKIVSGKNTIHYANDYKPNPVRKVNLTVGGTKELVGRDWQAGDTFTFLIEYKPAGSDQSWKKAGTTTVTYELDASGQPKADFNKFSFSEFVQGITYSTEGVYSFRVSEVAGSISGVSYDKVVSYFDVTVADKDMDGFLEIQGVKGYQNASSSYNDSTGAYHVNVTISNEYAPTGTAEAIININKTVTSKSGEDQTSAGYTFELYDENGSLVKTSEKTSAAGETSIVLTYEAKDAGNTFNYTLKESHGGEVRSGMSYDSTVYEITVAVVDDLDGTVSAYVYKTQPEQDKQNPEEDEEAEPPTEEPPAEDTETPENPENGEEETIPPAEIPNDSEVPDTPGEDGEEPEQGDSEPTTPPAEEPTETQDKEIVPTRNPEDAAPEEDELPGKEDLANSDADENQEESSDPADLPEDPENPENTGTTDEPPEEPIDPEQGETTTPETPDVSDDPDPEETPGEAPTNDMDIPAGAGNIYSASFINVYEPTETYASFSGKKVLTGRSMKSGEFTFALYETGNNFTVDEAMKPLEKVTNTENGAFSFARITFENVGIYRYVVREDPSGALGGITYDESEIHIIVTVSDKNGALTAVTEITDAFGKEAEIRFENSYAAQPVTVFINGTKTLSGADLSANMFGFLIYETDSSYSIDSAPLYSVSHDSSGRFTFGGMEFTEPGIYYFAVREDTTEVVEGLTYDETVYGIKIVVADDENGFLKAAVTTSVVGGGKVDAIRFANSYAAPGVSDQPVTPDGESPPTGDDTNLALYIGLLLVSAAAIIVLIVAGVKKKRKDDRNR